MAKINLGDEVIDTVSGFKGIAVARTQWLQGCDRIAIQPRVDKDGKLPESAAFDEPQIKVIKHKKVKADHDTGGPRPAMHHKESSWKK